MSYVNCPRCGFSLRLRASYLAVEHCPRCLVHRRVAVQMYVSDQPGGPQIPPESGVPDADA